MEEKERPILITMACEDMGSSAVEGSVKLPCAFCGREVWVTPASPHWTMSVQLCCTRCYEERPPGPVDSVNELTEAQRVEIARETGLCGDALDRLIEYAKHHYRRGGHD